VASVLAEEIVKPGVEAVVMFRALQRRVRAAIRQEPYLGFNALGDVYLAGKADAPAAAQRPAFGETMQAVRICREVEGMTSLSMLAVLERQHRATAAGDCIAARVEANEEKAGCGRRATSAIGADKARAACSDHHAGEL
jgi:hypothetical protein